MQIFTPFYFAFMYRVRTLIFFTFIRLTEFILGDVPIGLEANHFVHF